MYVIWEFVRPCGLVPVVENGRVILCQLAELVVLVLQAQICQCYFVDNLFSNLRVDRDPQRPTFFRYLFIVCELTSAEPFIVFCHKNKFSCQPGFYLLLALASAFISRVVALLKKHSERTGLWRIVVALNVYEVNVEALELFVVKRKVWNRAIVWLEKLAVRVSLIIYV